LQAIIGFALFASGQHREIILIFEASYKTMIAGKQFSYAGMVDEEEDTSQPVDIKTPD
jgi:hypothetical protein